MCSSRTSRTTRTSRNNTTELGAGVWRSRWLAAGALRLVAVGGPLALGTVTARVVAGALSAQMSRWLVVALALLAATVVSLGTARLGMRLMPLATLLKMAMLFPDRAPSRLKVARRATSAHEMKRYLADPGADAEETAATLLALLTALGRHDRKTRGHSERVRLYCDLIGAELGLSKADRGRLRWTGLLHDIGKLQVAAEVLNKPGKLDDDEWTMIRAHPDNGAQLAGPLADWLGPWFTGIAEHHERFDGAGYPRGLAGQEISLAGRAVSVVDAFETMTAARSYKSPMTTAAARAELTRCAGSHFDPAMVRAFLSIALPRLLWTMGPMTFLVNAPFLRWIPAATERAATMANASVGAASSAVGVTAVSVVLVAGQSPALMHPAHSHPHHAAAASSHVLAPPSATAGGPTSVARPGPAAPGPGATGRATAQLATAHSTQELVEPAASASATVGPSEATSIAPEPTPSGESGSEVDGATAPVGPPSVPSGQAKKSGGPVVPPGQAKKSGGPVVPPGQAKKSGGPVVPPGPTTTPSDPPGHSGESHGHGPGK